MYQMTEYELTYTPERRGFGKSRGVPDAVVWVKATGGGTGCRIPLLVELEGNLPNAIIDFREFSNRALSNRDYIRAQALGTVAYQTEHPRLVSLRFHIEETSYESAGMPLDGDESHLYDSLREWCALQPRRKILTASLSKTTDKWSLSWFGIEFSIFGLTIGTSIPSIRLKESGSWVGSLTDNLAHLVMPCVVVSKLCRWKKRTKSWTMPILFRVGLPRSGRRK